MKNVMEKHPKELKKTVSSPRQHVVVTVTEAHKTPQTGYASRDKIRNKAVHS